MPPENLEPLRLIDLSSTAQRDGVDRCRAFAGYVRRLATAKGRQAAVRRSGAEQLLWELSRSGRLSFGEQRPWEVRYLPGHEAVAAVVGRPAPGWPERLAKRQAQALHPVQGAIFRCPAETGDDHVDVFITDWSPCPAACAVAIHRHHPFGRRSRGAPPVHFTGRHVRHPLTGDLLPVWVADWVRADVGTGAVLVNPAHDGTDLGFARRTGLPIRFALAPEGSDSPSSWPAPPVVRTGITVRTGSFDGLSPGEAMNAYLRRLSEARLGWRHVDHHLEERALGALTPDETGSLALCTNCGLLEPARATPTCDLCDHGIQRVEAAAAPILEEVAGVSAGDGPITVVSPAGAVERELVLVPLLLHDLGIACSFDAMHVVQRCDTANLSREFACLAEAALVSARPSEVGVVRQQLVEQVERFCRQHARLLEAYRAPGGPVTGAAPPAVRGVATAIEQADLPRAFSQLYALQKQLLAGTGRVPALEMGYHASSHVLLGLPMPADVALADAWPRS
jgi:leucyl-tRNA synthetase